jgi:hypothetical protein
MIARENRFDIEGLDGVTPLPRAKPVSRPQRPLIPEPLPATMLAPPVVHRARRIMSRAWSPSRSVSIAPRLPEVRPPWKLWAGPTALVAAIAAGAAGAAFAIGALG